jgi:tight adherence protein C
MDSIYSQVQAMLVDSELFSLGLIFAAALLAVLGVAALFSRDEVEDRMGRVGRTGDEGRGATLRDREADFRYRMLFERLQRTFEPNDEREKSALRLRLVQGGFMRPSAIVTYYLWRLGLAVALPVVALLAAALFVGSVSPNILLVAAIAACVAGYYLPHLFLRHRISERQRAAREGFPDTLDMLLVCVEAGLGLSAAIERVGREVGRSHPILAEQFGLVGLEMRAGTSRGDALKNLARRLGVDEVNAFVTLLVQSETLGTSIADSLRVYAQEMRTARLLRAEELANKLPVKITIPLGLGILPCLIIVIMTPVAIRIARSIFPVLGG